jgi:hypothetical protein
MGRVLLAVILLPLVGAEGSETIYVAHRKQFDLLTGEQHSPDTLNRYAISFDYEPKREGMDPEAMGSRYRWQEGLNQASFVPDKYDDVSYSTAMFVGSQLGYGWCGALGDLCAWQFGETKYNSPGVFYYNTFLLRVRNETDGESFRYWKVAVHAETSSSPPDYNGHTLIKYEELIPIKPVCRSVPRSAIEAPEERGIVFRRCN